MPPVRRRNRIASSSSDESNSRDEFTRTSKNVKVTARKSTGTRSTTFTANNETSKECSSTSSSPTKQSARKSTGTRPTSQSRNNEFTNECSSTSSSPAKQSARKSTGTRPTSQSRNNEFTNEHANISKHATRQAVRRSMGTRSTNFTADNESSDETSELPTFLETRKRDHARKSLDSQPDSDEESSDEDLKSITRPRRRKSLRRDAASPTNHSLNESEPVLRRSSRRLAQKKSESTTTADHAQEQRIRSSYQNSVGRPSTSQMDASGSDSSTDVDDSLRDDVTSTTQCRRARQAPSGNRISKTRNQSGVTSDDDCELSDYSCSETPDSDADVPVDVRRSKTKNRTPVKRKLNKSSRKDQESSDESDKGSSSKQHGKPGLKKRGPKGTHPKKGSDSVRPDVLQNLVRKCVYFLLIEDRKKYVIRRKAIITHVFKDQEYSANVYKKVIHRANKFLKKTYGLELLRFTHQKDCYIIINLLLQKDLDMDDLCEFSKLQQQQYGLILYILTVIFMNGNFINEEDLWKALEPLGIDPSSRKPHPVFSDVKKYITTELVKQMYLKSKVINKDPLQYEFCWGLRATLEVDKYSLLQFACKIMSDTVPEDWILQHKDAMTKKSAADADVDFNTDSEADDTVENV